MATKASFTGIMKVMALLILLPQFAFGYWRQVGDTTATRSCLECTCLGPFASEGTDAAIDSLCSEIVRAPCDYHVKTGVMGLWSFIPAGNPSCGLTWAPTKAECISAYGGLQARRPFDACAAMETVNTFGDQKAGTITMGGQCIPPTPRSICG